MAWSSEQLEREAEETRARLTAKLEELRTRITPGEMVDQMVDYARDSGGAEFVRNLGDQVSRNPLPVALIGAGMAWLLIGRGGGNRSDGLPISSLGDRAGDGVGRLRAAASDTASRAGESVARAAGDAKEMAGDWSATAKRAGEQMSERAREAGSVLADAASSARDRLSELGEHASAAASSVRNSTASAYTGAREAASSTAEVGDTAASVGRRAAAMGRGFTDFCTEQPLVLVGLGLALGAALGAAFPSSDTENLLLGEAGDQLKDRAAKTAAEAYENASDVLAAASLGGANEVERQAAPAKAEEGCEISAAEASIIPTGDGGTSSFGTR